MKLEFQILALDTSRRTRCGTALNLLHSLASNGRLWTDPELCKENICLKSGEITLNIVDQDPQASNTDVRGPRAFLVTLNGHFDEIEALREPLLEHIKHAEFDDRYVVKDQISEKIACDLYPFLYKIENALRGFLIRFMATKIGPTWWSLNASSEMSKKANSLQPSCLESVALQPVSRRRSYRPITAA